MQTTQKTFFLFVDDSGSSCPDKSQATRRDGLDAFALGGFLIAEDDVERVKKLHKQFMISQKLECPNGSYKHHLHSTRIRCKKGHFEWLKCNKKATEFYSELNDLIAALPIFAHACVVDRPAYHERYSEGYEDKWQLCRSAYQILIERAVKFVRSVGGTKLIVHVEKTGRKEDKKIQDYHDVLRTKGMEFNTSRSAIYSPVEGEELASFVTKKVVFQTKASRLMQLADIVLYPLIKGGYDAEYPPYKLLVENKLIVDAHVEDVRSMGVKYYCFPRLQKDEKPL
ncbi:DUF3800 domain-containing protein [Photobacterium damselae]|uniref:DUF3800 domain-containing protein n=1 Tax=Photobacterium damselae TaxID=38293 RepID=UPI00370A1295